MSEDEPAFEKIVTLRKRMTDIRKGDRLKARGSKKHVSGKIGTYMKPKRKGK